MSKNFTARVLLTLSILLSTSALAQGFTAANTLVVSKGTYTGATESNGNSYQPSVSKNGRFIVFTSTAGNLVNSPAVTVGRQHVYLYDRQAGTLELVSQTYTGVQSPVDCFHPAVSNDGRYVAYTCSTTLANNVSAMVETGLSEQAHLNIPIGGQHIYIRDRKANDTLLATQVSLPVKKQAVDEFGVPQVEDEPGGGGGKRPVLTTVTYRVAAFRLNFDGEVGCTPLAQSDTDTVYCPALSDNAKLSGDGRYTVYDTDANNLAYVSTIASGYPTLQSGTDYNATTGLVNGGKVFFPYNYYEDGGDSIRDIYLRDGSDNSNHMVNLICQFYDPTKCPVQGTADSFKPSISDDGKYITFHSDTPFLDLDFNAASDVYLVERSDINGEVAKLSRISNDLTRILAANGSSTNASISGDGRYIAFQSTATNLASSDSNGKSDIFIYDRNFNNVLLCSKNGTTQSDSDSFNPSISGSGEYVSFDSAATTFGLAATARNIYVSKTTRNSAGKLTSCTVTPASPGAGAGADSAATVSGVAVVPETLTSGNRTLRSSVVYQSSATNLASTVDTNGTSDVFQAPICSTIDLTTDTDGDGTTDCFDQCVKDPIKVTDFDTDGDGYADCEDGCASDPQKQDAGICGCGTQEVDTDGDGTFDCKDTCPSDPAKKAPGICGCGRVDVDNNANGIIDCLESSLPIPTPTPVNTPLPGSVTPTPAPTPSDLVARFRAYVPPAPSVSKAGKGYVNVSYNFSSVPSGTEVSSLRLTVYKFGSRKTATVRNAYYGKKLKLPVGFESGKLFFSVQYRAKIGNDTIRSQEGTKTGQVSVSVKSRR